MWANRVVDRLISRMSPVIGPIQVISTFLCNGLIFITFGLFLFPLNLIWMWFFLGPLIWTSWLWDKAPKLRIPAAALGIPAAVTGDVYAGMVPSVSEKSRVVRLLVCRTWPFSRTLTAFVCGTAKPTPELQQILSRLASSNPDIREFLTNLTNIRTTHNDQRWEPRATFKG